jgi:hypothetical protein
MNCRLIKRLGLVAFLSAMAASCGEDPVDPLTAGEVFSLPTPRITEVLGLNHRQLRVSWNRVDDVGYYRLQVAPGANWDHGSPYSRYMLIENDEPDSITVYSAVWIVEEGGLYGVRLRCENGTYSHPDYSQSFEVRERSRWSNPITVVMSDETPPEPIAWANMEEVDEFTRIVRWPRGGPNARLEVQYGRFGDDSIGDPWSQAPHLPAVLPDIDQRSWELNDHHLGTGLRLREIQALCLRAVDQAGNASPGVWCEADVKVRNGEWNTSSHVVDQWEYCGDTFLLNQTWHGLLLYRGPECPILNLSTTPASEGCTPDVGRAIDVGGIMLSESSGGAKFVLLETHPTASDSLIVRVLDFVDATGPCPSQSFAIPVPVIGGQSCSPKLIPSRVLVAVTGDCPSGTSRMRVDTYSTLKGVSGPIGAPLGRTEIDLDALKDTYFPDVDRVRVRHAFSRSIQVLYMILELESDGARQPRYAYLSIVDSDVTELHRLDLQVSDVGWQYGPSTPLGSVAPLLYGLREVSHSRRGIWIPWREGELRYCPVRSDEYPSAPEFPSDYKIMQSFGYGPVWMLGSDRRLHSLTGLRWHVNQ